MVRIQGDAELLRCLLQQATPTLLPSVSSDNGLRRQAQSLIENDLHSREVSSTVAINSQSR